ncbi:hypothetical protein KM043_018466 [Ampulex compressa]|nr:hypothetical protein KM043_018466 [Ampulex compressa]
MLFLAFILFTFASDISVLGEDANYSIGDLADALLSPSSTVQACLDSKGLILEEIVQLLEEENEDADKVIDQLGCFLACIAQAEGLMVGNKPDVDGSTKFLAQYFEPSSIEIREHVETCTAGVKFIRHECEVGLYFMVCVMLELEADESKEVISE